MNILIRLILLITILLANTSNFSYAEQSIQGPALGSISSNFGFRIDPFTGNSRFHHGLDIAGTMSSPIYAMQDGIVVRSGENGGYGLEVTIRHFYPDIPEMPDIQTTYGHCSVLYAQIGQYVKRGQVIALMGSTGRSTGPHVHFEVSYMGQSVDPIDYLTKLPSYLDYVAKVRSHSKYANKFNNNRAIGGR